VAQVAYFGRLFTRYLRQAGRSICQARNAGRFLDAHRERDQPIGRLVRHVRSLVRVVRAVRDDDGRDPHPRVVAGRVRVQLRVDLERGVEVVVHGRHLRVVRSAAVADVLDRNDRFGTMIKDAPRRAGQVDGLHAARPADRGGDEARRDGRRRA